MSLPITIGYWHCLWIGEIGNEVDSIAETRIKKQLQLLFLMTYKKYKSFYYIKSNFISDIVFKGYYKTLTIFSKITTKWNYHYL